MSKHIACGDIVHGCKATFDAPNEEELMKEVAAHAADEHGVKEVTPELLSTVKAAIRTS
jgi:predicted small metal-binding protein